MGSGWRCLHNFADTFFTAYAKLVVRFTATIGLIGVLLAVALSLGLLVSNVEKRDVNELWIDLDSRLVDEKDAFEQAFGGLTRKLTSIVSSSSSGRALYHSNGTLQDGSSAMEALQEAMGVWASVNFTFEGRPYDYRDVCEKSLVPAPFRRGQRSADLYGRYSQCMANDQMFTSLVYPTLRATMASLPATFTPVPAGWGIDEFPCSRASALDCFREGEEVDWPDALRELGLAAFPLATAATTTYGALRDQIGARATGLQPVPTLTVQEVLASGMVLPCWFGSPVASLACLSATVDLSNQSEVIASISSGLSGLAGFLGPLDPTGRLATAVGQQLAPILPQLATTTTQSEAEAVALQAKTVVIGTLQAAAGSHPVVGPLLVYLILNDLILARTLPADTVVGGTCLGTAVTDFLGAPPGTVSAAILGLQAELVGAARFFGSLGFYWRPSYRSMTPSQIVEHFNRAANAQLDPAVRADPTACILGRASCCQAWNGAFLATSISIAGDARPQRRRVPGTAVFSLDLSAVTLVRAGWEDFNHNNPVWQDQLGARYPDVQWSSEARREDLARAFDTRITDDWLRLYERRAASGYGAGEEFAALRFDFGTGNSLTDVLEDASSVDGALLALSYGVMAALIVLSLGNYGTAIVRLVGGGGKEEAQLALVNSHGFLGLLGLGVIALSSAAGIGLSAFMQITLNGLTVNLVPFVSLGLGIDDMFVLAHAMTALNDRSRSVNDNMCAVLRLAGPSVCLTSVANAAAFILIYTVPIGAIRQLVLVLMVAVLVNLVLLLLLFVPLMVFDMKRNHANRMDLIFVKASAVSKSSGCSEESDTLMAAFIDRYYAPLLSSVVGKVVILVLFVAFCAVMLWNGITNTEQGLRTSDIALRNTYQRDLAELTENVITIQKSNLLLIARNREFSDARAQRQILDLMDSLEPSPWIVQGTRVHDVNFLSNGSASLLALYGLQHAAGVLGACPAANVTTPIAVPQCYDSFFPQWYQSIGVALAPYLHCRDGNGTRVPCESAGAVLSATRTNYYFDGLNEHQKYLDAISDVRARVDPHSNGDVQAFSIGHIFYFWEQYYDIEVTLIAAIGYGLLGVFIITFLFQLNPWMSLIVCLVILMIDIELVGLMRAMGVKINAISIANLVISVGMAVEFTAHYARAFLLAAGSRNERMKVALHEMLQPMINGALSTIIALSVLSLNEFPFFRRYYALMFVVMVLVSFANGLILLPVILSVIGPPEVEDSSSSGSYQARGDVEDADGVEGQNGTEMRRVESTKSQQKIIVN